MEQRILIGPGESARGRALPSWLLLLPVLAAALLAHAPAVNNGFISDDYVIMDRVGSWMRDIRQFEMPSEGIRLTSYACFALLRTVFGYRPEWYHAFAIALHLINIVLLWRLLLTMGQGRKIAFAGALIFGTVQNPQEAVWWLAGMSDTLVGGFILATLLSWCKQRFVMGMIFAALAMASKDSGLVLLVLVPLLDFLAAGRFRLRREYLLLAIPASGHLALFAMTARTNSYLASGLYAFGPQAAWTVVHSLHRLLFPWGYFLAAAVALGRRWRMSPEIPALLAWIVVALLPYSFITFQSHVPSRSQYPAAIGLSWLLALLVDRLPTPRMQACYLAAFMLGNAGYLWLAKDRHYVERAAPTEKLLTELRRLDPRCIAVEGFPYNPWVAKDLAPLVPGWRQDMIRVDEPAPDDCLHLRWHAKGGGSYLRSPL